MKLQLLSLILLFLLSYPCSAQNSNTFFITKNAEPENVAIVLSEGDKLKIKHSSGEEQATTKGKIDTISSTYLVIAGERVELSSINAVSVHSRKMKVFGALIFAAGTSFITAGLIRANNPKTVTKKNFTLFGDPTYSTITRDGSSMLLLGELLCGFSTPLFLLKRNYSSDKFRFSTHVNE